MKDVYVFIPEPGNNKAIIASSAIARAMRKMNKVAILRCVWRQGQGNVVVGVLTPNVSSIQSIVSWDLSALFILLSSIYLLLLFLFIFSGGVPLP